jgi:hypothetical protein
MNAHRRMKYEFCSDFRAKKDEILCDAAAEAAERLVWHGARA